MLGNHIAWALRLQAGPRIKARYKSQGMWFILLLSLLSHISIAKLSLLFRSLPCSSPSAYGPTFLSVSLLVASPSSAVCPRIGSRAVLEVSALNPCEQDKPNLPCCVQLVLLSIQRSFRLTQPNLTQSASSRGLRIRGIELHVVYPLSHVAFAFRFIALLLLLSSLALGIAKLYTSCSLASLPVSVSPPLLLSPSHSARNLDQHGVLPKSGSGALLELFKVQV